MKGHAQIVAVAGPNGAGKSTTAPAIVRQAFGIEEFVFRIRDDAREQNVQTDAR